jgi:hypothetical protein
MTHHEFWVSWVEQTREDYTDMGGDVEYDTVHHEESFDDVESAVRRFRELVNAGQSVTLGN